MCDVIRFYENYKEEHRLTTDRARKVEFITTTRALDDLLPPKGKILDCAAGTGIYAFYLADRGFDVTATDITPRHIEHIDKQLESMPFRMETAVLDATRLTLFEDGAFDVVLNMGPFYHLTETSDREHNLTECLRVLSKGGLLVTAYINRFFIFPWLAAFDDRYINSDFVDRLCTTGALKHGDPDCFWTDSYYATPEEMADRYKKMGLETLDHFAQDGIAPLLKNVMDGWSESQFETWCDYHYRTCREKSIIGAGNHAIIAGRKR